MTSQFDSGNNDWLGLVSLFHRCINESKSAIEADNDVGGTGLFLDIHGHGHPNVWAELGYELKLLHSI